MVGIVLAAWIAIAPVGGIKELFTGIINQAPEMLSRPGAQGLYTDKYWIMQFLVLPFGIWFCPHIWSKSLMAKDEDAIAKSAISIPVSQILIYGVATLFIGLAGHLLATPEQVGAADNILPVLMLLHSNWLVAAAGYGSSNRSRYLYDQRNAPGFLPDCFPGFGFIKP